jgi:hypothetical protein
MAQHVSRVKPQTTQKVRLDIMLYLSYGFSDSCHAALSKQKLQFSQRLNITFSSLFPTPFLLSSSIVLDRLIVLPAHPAPSLFSFRPIFALFLLVPTSTSHRHFLSFSFNLLWYTRIFSVTHLSYSLLYHGSLILPLLLLVRVFVPLAKLLTPPSSFCSHSFHF